MELSILYLNWMSVEFFALMMLSLPAYCFFNLTISADPDEMPPYAAFHLGRHC